jgi:hypothetical protein
MRALAIAGVIVALLGAAWSRAPDGGTRAALRVVDSTPLTVAGSGFVGRERVSLRLRVGHRRPAVRSVRATQGGSFRVAFGPLLAVDPCEGAVVITATGSRGSTASWKRACRPPSTRPPRVSG